MKKFIIFEKADGSKIALETTCIGQIEAADMEGRCYVYYYDFNGSDVRRMCVIGEIKALVEKINDIETDLK